MGVMHLRQEASDASSAAAFSWFEKAADQGHATAMFNLGVAYWEGSGITQNKKKALALWEQAALKGDSGAQFNLGLAYYIGEERAPDLSLAQKWIGLAADQNHPEAKRILNVIKTELVDKKQLTTQGASITAAATASTATTNSESGSSTDATSASNMEVAATVPASTESATASASDGTNRQYWRSGSEAVTLFDRPGGTPFRDIPAGTPLEVTGQDGGWVKVTMPDGLKTWIYSKFIDIADETGIITGDGVRVRPNPSTDNAASPPLGKYRRVDKVSVISDEGQWVEIRAPKSIGGWLKVTDITQYKDTVSGRNRQWQRALSNGL